VIALKASKEFESDFSSILFSKAHPAHTLEEISEIAIVVAIFLIVIRLLSCLIGHTF
jgi:hypothetical protein